VAAGEAEAVWLFGEVGDDGGEVGDLVGCDERGQGVPELLVAWLGEVGGVEDLEVLVGGAGVGEEVAEEGELGLACGGLDAVGVVARGGWGVVVGVERWLVWW
jgi:hypothetical protein